MKSLCYHSERKSCLFLTEVSQKEQWAWLWFEYVSPPKLRLKSECPYEVGPLRGDWAVKAPPHEWMALIIDVDGCKRMSSTLLLYRYFLSPSPSSLHSISTPRDDPAFARCQHLDTGLPSFQNCDLINSVHYKLHNFRHSINSNKRSNTKRSNTELEPTKNQSPTPKKSMILSLKSLHNFTK